MEHSTIQINPNIRATAYLVENAGTLKANATVSVNDTMVVRNLKVVEGANGLIVNMPSRKVGDKWYDVAVPASPDAAAQIKAAVMEAYDKAIELARTGIPSPKPELNPADVKVEVWSLRDSTADNKDIATCSVKVADTFIINNVKIREGGELGLKIQLPGEFDGNKKWHETVSVYDGTVRDAVVGAYLEREHTKANIIGNTSFAKIAENPEDRRFKNYTGELADKVIAQLDAANIPYSGKIDRENDKTTITFNVKDEAAVNKAVIAAKSPSQANQQKIAATPDILAEKAAQAAALNAARSAPAGTGTQSQGEIGG